MSKGWHKHPKEHALASRGIESKRFSNSTDIPFYDTSIREPDDFTRREAQRGKIVYMSPEKYMEESAKIQKSPIEEQYQRVSPIYVKRYKERSLKGEKMPIPYLDYSRKEQEGRHRAVVSKELGEKEIPVVVVKDLSDEEYREFMKKKYPEQYKYMVWDNDKK